MDQEKRNPILSVDLRVRIRGEVYAVSLTRVVKWLALILIAGFRLYRSWNAT